MRDKHKEPDMEGEDKNEKSTEHAYRDQKSGHCGCNLVTFVAGFFMLTTFLSVGILVWRVFFYRKTMTDESLRENYPGYFKSLEEQIEFQNRLIAIGLKLVSDFRNVTKYCDTDCQGRSWSTKRGRKRAVQQRESMWGDSVYHGCCESSVYFTSPSSRKSRRGKWKKLVQLKGSQQFFQVCTCIQDPKCNGCRCTYQTELLSAVVFKEGATEDGATIDDLEIDLFEFDGCCKCVNDGS